MNKSNIECIYPKLHSIKTMPDEFKKHSTICVSKDGFSIGRSLNNCEVVACLSISRLHCVFVYDAENSQWKIIDHSSFGILVNGNKVEKSQPILIYENDIIQLDLAGEFVFKFSFNDSVDSTKKRKYSELCDNQIDGRIQDAKDKFNNSQTIEMGNMKNKISVVKLKKFDFLNEKLSLEKDLRDKCLSLEKDYQNKILELRGQHDEVEKQKEILRNENDEIKLALKKNINDKVLVLEEKIKEQKSHEAALENENKILLERLEKERIEFENKLQHISSTKDEKLKSLETQLGIKEEELKEEKERMDKLRLQEIKQCENEKEKELKSLQEKMEEEQTRKLKEIESLKLQMEMQKHMNEETRKLNEIKYQEQIDILKKESDEIRNRMLEENAVTIARQVEQESLVRGELEEVHQEKKSLEEKLLRIEEEKLKLQELLLQKSRQAEEEIQRLQQEQSENNKVVCQQFEKEKQHLVNLLCKESETCNSTVQQMHNQLQVKPAEIIDLTTLDMPSTSSGINYMAKEREKEELNRIMDAELQCSICSDLFIQPVTLNCSHSFCKYCIETWRKKKNDCPVCRTKIKTQLLTNILESLICTMVESLGEEAKERRAQIIKERSRATQEETSNTKPGFNSTNARLQSGGTQPSESTDPSNSGSHGDSSDSSDVDSFNESSDHNSSYESDSDGYYGYRWQFGRGRQWYSSEDNSFDSDQASGTGLSESERTTQGSELSTVEGLPGSYYGGYGRCYRCNHPGHWAPGCPFI